MHKTAEEDVLPYKPDEPFIDKGHHTEKVPSLCSQRWILSYLFCSGFFFVYALRVNISVALVCMVKSPVTNFSTMSMSGIANVTQGDQCGQLERAEFDWDKSTKSTILASFFYGYIITQIPGGWLADRFGGRRVFGIAMGISGVCTVLMPVCARTSVILVYVLRIILGLATGVVFPAGHSMWGRWAPRLERSKLVATSHVGAWFGTIVTFASSGLLCEYGFDGGWASIFYITEYIRFKPTLSWLSCCSCILHCYHTVVTNTNFAQKHGQGGLCCIWVVIWFIQVRDSPIEHPRITDVERNYIVRNIEYDTRNRSSKVPWTKMAKSTALWATITAHVCANWANYTLITSLPVFMKGVLKFDIKSNGALSAVPYVCTAVMSIMAGHFADCLRSRRILTTTHTRKVFQCIAFFGAAIFLIATGFVPCTKRELAVVFLCLAVSSTGFNRGAVSVNHIDIGPNYIVAISFIGGGNWSFRRNHTDLSQVTDKLYRMLLYRVLFSIKRFAGILFGITNTMATIPGMISPIVAGALTPNDTAEEWRNVFYVSAAFYVFGAIIFGTFASGELQPWADDKEENNTKIQMVNELKLLPRSINNQMDN